MRKSSLGVRDKRRQTTDVQRRPSGIPRPSRSSSETRDIQSKWGATGMKRSKSYVAISTPNQYTPKVSRYNPYVGSAGSSASSKRYLTPLSDGGSNVYKVSTKPVKDTRNLSDKVWQQQAVSQIISFFNEESEVHTFLPRPLNLRNLMLKNFVDIVSYLVRCFDHRVVINMSNYTEEIPLFMKSYGYPGTVNQSWLKTAYTQHAFPSVLGLLSWLVTLVQFSRYDSYDSLLAEVGYIEHETFPHATPQVFLNHFCTKFLTYNKDQSAVDEVDTEFIQGLCLQNGVADEEIQKIESEVQALQESLNDPVKEAEMEKYSAEQAKYNAVLKDRSLLQAHLSKMADYINDIESKLVIEKSSLEREAKNIALLKERHQNLLDQLNTQTMSVDERDDLLKTCKEISASIRTNEEYATEIKNGAFKVDIDLTKKREKMRKVFQAYNTKILMESCWLPQLKDMKAEFNVTLPDAKQHLAAISHTFCVLDKNLQDQLETLKHHLSDALAQHEEVKETLQKYSDDTKELKLEVQQNEEALLVLKKRTAEEEINLKSKISEVELKSKMLIDKETEEITEAKLELMDVSERNEKIQAETESLQKDALVFFSESAKITQEFMDNVEKNETDTMKRVYDYLKSIEEKLGKNLCDGD